MKAALAGHICRCAAYPAIVRTVLDSAAVLRREKKSVEPAPASIIEIKQPMVRNFSTHGGHLPGDELIEGPRTVTRKWQGYPPEDLNVIGKAIPALPEVSVPRFTGKAQYASRIWFPDLLYARFLTCPHPHARIKSIDTSRANKTPAGAKELTLEQLVPGDLLVDGRIQSHVVRFNEILTDVVLPAPKPGVLTSFEKLRPRGVWDFAMASLALSIQMRDKIIEDARVVFGGISGKPLREHAVENSLKGKPLSADLASNAVSIALANAAPLKYNSTKIDMAKGLLASGLSKLNGIN